RRTSTFEISNVTPTTRPFRRNMGQGRHLGPRRAHVDSTNSIKGERERQRKRVERRETPVRRHLTYIKLTRSFCAYTRTIHAVHTRRWRRRTRKRRGKNEGKAKRKERKEDTRDYPWENAQTRDGERPM
ncbi:hypothetical protein ALC60_02155, partial [Trachymyrmex zeteki]